MRQALQLPFPFFNEVSSISSSHPVGLLTCKPALQALHELLKQTHRGYIIPPRPEKNTVEGQRASEEFVEGRRGAVQIYLNQLAAHPVIGKSEVPPTPLPHLLCPSSRMTMLEI
jgi:hypothetical protein